MFEIGSLLDDGGDFILDKRERRRVSPVVAMRLWKDPGHTLLKSFLRSYSLSSGIDFSRKKRALSVAADMIAVAAIIQSSQFWWKSIQKKKWSASRNPKVPSSLAARTACPFDSSAPVGCRASRAIGRRPSIHSILRCVCLPQGFRWPLCCVFRLSIRSLFRFFSSLSFSFTFLTLFCPLT